MTSPLRFSQRTPCMDDPHMFDRDLPDESPEESNARMERAARICRTACPEFATCDEFYTPMNRPPGVVAGRYRKRYEPKVTAAWGRYKEGDPCAGCGAPMIVDPEKDLPNGWVLRHTGPRCWPCTKDQQLVGKRRRRGVSA